MQDADGLAAALEDARRGHVTTVIHCPTVPRRPLLESGAFWDLGVAEVAADTETAALADEHAATRRRLQRRF